MILELRILNIYVSKNLNDLDIYHGIHKNETFYKKGFFINFSDVQNNIKNICRKIDFFNLYDRQFFFRSCKKLIKCFLIKNIQRYYGRDATQSNF